MSWLPNVLGVPDVAPDGGPPTAPPPMAGPAPAGLPPQHSRVADLLSKLAPIIAATIAAKQGGPLAASGALQGFHDATVAKQAELKQHEAQDYQRHQQQQTQQDRQQQLADTRKEKQAEFRMKAVEALAKIDDPTIFTQAAGQLADIYAQQFGAPRTDILGSLTFSNKKTLERDQKLAGDAIKKVEANFANGAYDAYHANPTIHLGDGRTMSYRDARNLAGLTVQDQTGNEIPPAAPVVKSPAGTETERGAKLKGEIRAAKQAGDMKKAATLQAEYDDLVTAKRELGLADNTPKTSPRDRFNVQQFTKPDGTIGLMRVNMDTGEGTEVKLGEGAGGGKPSDTERLSKAYLDRTADSNQQLTGFEQQLSGLGSQIDVQLPNMLKSEQGQLYAQARDEFINAALRRESGAAIQPSEYTRYDKIYFVRPGDTPATIAQKQRARARVVAGFRVAAGNLANVKPASEPESPAAKSAAEKLSKR